MPLLDTNVVSDLMTPSPDPAVIAWLDGVDPALVHLSAVTVAEIRTGLALLPEGLRRTGLTRAFDRYLGRGFLGRVLPFDETCAGPYADIVATRRRSGQPIAALDAQIAAIALVNGLAVATRNVGDFVECGVRVINPFER